jgi:hypothetical protein
MVAPDFSTCGIMARPAGVAGMMSSPFIGGRLDVSSTKGSSGSEHALRQHSPYAETTPDGWMPREPLVKPHQQVTGAGCVSAGCIDNTYLPKPLENAWGKARELSKAEKQVLPHKQATDLLAVAKGAKMPPPAMSVDEMESVREPYSKTIPLFHPMEPLRTEAGFIRSPNIIPGAKPPPVSPMRNFRLTQEVNQATWKADKVAFDQSRGTSRIPVFKVIGLNASSTAASKQPQFVTTPAGLPGGLSLIPK